MAQHSNYAQDRDLMMEAYASVKGKVPATFTTAKPRMLNEAHEGGHSPVEACTAAIDAIAKGDTSAVQTCVDAIDELSATLQGDEKVAVYEDLRDYINGSLQGSDVAEDLQDYLKRGLGHSEDNEEHTPEHTPELDSSFAELERIYGKEAAAAFEIEDGETVDDFDQFIDNAEKFVDAIGDSELEFLMTLSKDKFEEFMQVVKEQHGYRNSGSEEDFDTSYTPHPVHGDEDEEVVAEIYS